MSNTPANIFSLNRGFNPNAQFTIGNLVAFADAAQSSPTDGIGGSPTSTITRTTSSPLDGTASFLFTKPASNVQGEGFSGDCVLQPSDQTKVMRLEFDYQISSGTYTGLQTLPAFSDLTAWMYDVTNAVMYQMSLFQLDGTSSSVNQYKYYGEWQVPVGCLQARIIFFVGNTTTNAFTVKFNNLAFGRLKRNPSASGIAGVAALGSTQLIPNGVITPIQFDTVTYDPNGMWSGSSFGWVIPRAGNWLVQGSLQFNGNTNGIRELAANVNGASRYSFGYEGPGTPNNLVPNGSAYLPNLKQGDLVYLDCSQTAGTTLGVGVNVAYSRFSISNPGAIGTLGVDADTRVVAAKYGMNTAYTLPATMGIPYQFDTKAYDTTRSATFGVGITFTYFAPIAGFYQFILGVRTSNNQSVSGTGALWLLSANINGTTFIGSLMSSIRNQGSTYNLESVGVGFGYLNSGDALTFTSSSIAASFGIQASHLEANYISIDRMSGPAQVQASEVPKASYNTTAGQAISNAATPIVNFDTIIYDTFSLVTTGASWKFTANRSGKVTVHAIITYASAVFTINNCFKLFLYKNGSLYKTLNSITIMATVTDPISIQGAADVAVLAGDTIDVRTSHGESASRSLTTTAAENYIDVKYTDGF